jgi:hypothetical protein
LVTFTRGSSGADRGVRVHNGHPVPDQVRALGLTTPAELELVRFRGGPRRDVRAAVVYRAAETTSEPSAKIAARCGYGGSVRAVVARARERLGFDPAFAELVEDARARLRYLVSAA